MIALILAALLAQEDPLRQARELLEQLRSDKIEERGAAAKKLKDLGAVAVPVLEKAAAGGDAEIAAQARELLRIVEVRRLLTPRLLAALPGVDDRLARDDPHEWTAVFVLVMGDDDDGDNPKLATLHRSDIEPLVPRAIQGAATPEEKDALCSILHRRKFKAAIPGLRALLADPDETVRNGAAYALGDMHARQAIPDLLNLLEDGDVQVRETASGALGDMKVREAIPGILRHFKGSYKQPVDQAAMALVDLRAVEVVPELLALLETGDANQKARAILVLGRLQVEAALPRLLPLLQDKSPTVRAKAAEAAGSLDAVAAKELLLNLLDDRDGEVRRDAMMALARVGAKEAIPRIFALVKDPDLYLRNYVGPALRQLEAKETIPKLRELLKSENADERGSAMEALRSLEAREAIPDLLALLDKTAADEQWRPMQVLRFLKAKELIPRLLTMLKDPESNRAQAASALADLGAVEALPDLRTLLGDADRDLRQTAANALGTLKDQKAAPRLRELLDDPAPEVGWAAFNALDELKAPGLEPAARGYLEDPDPWVRECAASWLCRQGIADGVPLLLEEESGLDDLNALRRPELTRRLRGLPAPKDQAGTPQEILEAIGRGLGLAVEIEPPVRAGEKRWMATRIEIPPDDNLFEALRGLEGYGYELVLETDRLRLLRGDAALRFWRAWWSARSEK